MRNFGNAWVLFKLTSDGDRHLILPFLQTANHKDRFPFRAKAVVKALFADNITAFPAARTAHNCNTDDAPPQVASICCLRSVLLIRLQLDAHGDFPIAADALSAIGVNNVKLSYSALAKTVVERIDTYFDRPHIAFFEVICIVVCAILHQSLVADAAWNCASG